MLGPGPHVSLLMSPPFLHGTHLSRMPVASLLHACEEAIGQVVYSLVPVESAPPGLKSQLRQATSPGSPNPRAG
jgi:hypothetical protein